MSDQYTAIETALASELRTLSAYFPNSWQISKADELVLDKGGNYFYIVYPGAFPMLPKDTKNRVINWEYQSDLMVRFKSYSDAFAKLKAVRSAILNLLLQEDYTLGRTAGVVEVLVSAEERPQSVYAKGAREDALPVFIAQRLIVTVRAYFDFGVD